VVAAKGGDLEGVEHIKEGLVLEGRREGGVEAVAVGKPQQPHERLRAHALDLVLPAAQFNLQYKKMNK
jgi:hypothetical protein